MRRNLKYLLKIPAICIIIYTIFSSINIIKGDSSLNASELVIDDWIIDSITEGSYDDYVLLWDSLGVVPSDYLTLETHPTDIKFLIYQHTTSDATIYVEIHIYDSMTEAESELNNQKWHSRPPIFERFLYGERIFFEGPYLFFVFSNEVAEQILIPYNKYGQTYISLVDDFFIKLFQKISPILYGYDANPPDVIFSGKVIWGVRPGDKFTWNSSHNTFTGSLQTGMSHKSGSSVTTWEIIEISDDYLAILIGEHRDNFKIFNEYFSSIILDTEYTIYTWHTVDEGPFNLVTSSLSQATIYPLYMNGKTIRDFIEDEIEHLPEKNYMEGDLSISGHGRTSSGSGYTPLKTEWRDITIHKGTGILTSYDFYYNDNEFSITTSQSMNLVDTNLDLNSRFVNIQILELDAITSSNTPERGETLSIQAEVKDINDDLVEGAVVSASIGSAWVEFSEMGNGRYEGTIQTRDLHIGEHQIVVTAEKEGYEPGAATQTITVKTPALYIAVELPSITVRKGGKITLNVEVKDVSNDPINGATVTSNIEEQEIVLLEKGNGEYQTKIDTKELEEGPYTIDVSAEKEGYSAGISQVSVTVEKAAGIPGFPYLSIIVGLLFGIFILWFKRIR